jgi:hypothetical protein
VGITHIHAGVLTPFDNGLGITGQCHTWLTNSAIQKAFDSLVEQSHRNISDEHTEWREAAVELPTEAQTADAGRAVRTPWVQRKDRCALICRYTGTGTSSRRRQAK